MTFRHRRALEEHERQLLLRNLVKPDGRQWDLLIACVLPERTDLIFKVLERPDGDPYELSQIIEKAKNKTAKFIVKNTGERFPPFYAESYDRIIRDEVELEQRWEEIFEAPTTAELAEDPDDYAGLWVAGT